MVKRTLATLTKTARYLIAQVVAARSLASLAYLIGAAEDAKRKRLITAAELSAIYELGAKKEAILGALQQRKQKTVIQGASLKDLFPDLEWSK